MVVSRAALAASSCTHCRSSILKLVCSSPGSVVALRCLRPLPEASRHYVPSRQALRCFTTSPTSFEHLDPSRSPDLSNGAETPKPREGVQEAPEDFHEDEIKQVEDSEHGALLQDTEAVSETPWYLEVEPPRHSTHLFEPAPLPDLPPGSPLLLSHLLTYASDDLGLEDLKILDLREMQPPPALGANLIMMFGTVRSERHLHISAGRVVRWLRSNHGISANADGRLGPNQLKTRLKRKRKKEALLGARGVRARNEDDDGIRTGWVCVNLGPVGPKMGKVVEYRNEDGQLSGFGAESMDLQTTLVLQMFTGAKRQDLQLEGLWERSLEASRRRVAQLREVTFSLKPTTPSPTSSATQTGYPRSYSTMAAQRRFFSQESLVRGTVSESPSRTDEFETLATKPHLSDAEKVKLCHYLKNDYSVKLKTLTQLRRYIDRLPLDEQRPHLADIRERGSYAYLAKVAQDCLSSEDTFLHRAWMYEKARQHSLSGYPFEYIQNLVDELCLSGIPLPSRSSLLNLLRTILYPVQDIPIAKHMELILKVLKNVEERATHQPLIASDVLTTLISGLSSHTNPADIKNRDRIQDTLYELLIRSNIRCPEPEELISLLAAFSSQDNWTLFWEIWGLPPLYGVPRTHMLYTYLFRRMAETNHQLNCQRALRRCIEELVIERPRIQLPHYPRLVEAAMACVRVADPNAERVLDEVQRLSRQQLTPALKRKARGEFVLLMAQLREKSLFDGRGPARAHNQSGPSYNLPMRDRMAVKRLARQKARVQNSRLAVSTPQVISASELAGR